MSNSTTNSNRQNYGTCNHDGDVWASEARATHYQAAPDPILIEEADG